MKIYEYGMAPQAKIDGFDWLVETVVSTEEQLKKNHAEDKAVYVKGAEISNRPGYFEFARFESKKAHVAAAAEFLGYMTRCAQSVIYPDAKTCQVVVAPAENPSFWLGGFNKLETAKTFCARNHLPFTEHDACPAPV